MTNITRISSINSRRCTRKNMERRMSMLRGTCACDCWLTPFESQFIQQLSISRESIFRQNVRFIHSKNRSPVTFNLDINHMADMSRDELKLMNGKRHSKGYNGGQEFNKAAYGVRPTTHPLLTVPGAYYAVSCAYRVGVCYRVLYLTRWTGDYTAPSLPSRIRPSADRAGVSVRPAP